MKSYLAHLGRSAVTGLFGGAACGLVFFLLGEHADRQARKRTTAPQLRAVAS